MTERIAALDVGTNTVLMLVVECDADRPPRRIADLARITRLGRGVDASQRLDPASAQNTLDAISEFVVQARSLGATKLLSAATAALRDAIDGPEFIQQVKARTGIDLEVISGDTEAQLAYLASINGLQLDRLKKILIADIGGGSTELIRAEPDAPLQAVSLPIGSVRLTERIVKSDPPHAREAADLRIAIDQALDDLHWDFQPDLMVGIAGTATTICAVALGMDRYDPDKVHGHRLPIDEVLRVLGLFGSVPLEERKQLPGVEAGRADVLFAGTAILERVMGHFNLHQVIISDQGVRWGLVWRELERRAASH
jgi:exopolyphosphatase/guanosine-5'-triphosphate,3'-diphosphate pyrophosphatase